METLANVEMFNQFLRFSLFSILGFYVIDHVKNPLGREVHKFVESLGDATFHKERDPTQTHAGPLLGWPGPKLKPRTISYFGSPFLRAGEGVESYFRSEYFEIKSRFVVDLSSTTFTFLTLDL